jgi:hypothetical protein
MPTASRLGEKSPVMAKQHEHGGSQGCETAKQKHGSRGFEAEKVRHHGQREHHKQAGSANKQTTTDDRSMKSMTAKNKKNGISTNVRMSTI